MYFKSRNTSKFAYWIHDEDFDPEQGLKLHAEVVTLTPATSCI